MQSLNVINNRSRMAVQTVLSERLENWCQKWFGLSPGVNVCFNDSLFKQAPLSGEPSVMTKTGDFVLTCTAGSFAQLAETALQLDMPCQNSEDERLVDALKDDMLRDFTATVMSDKAQPFEVCDRTAVEDWPCSISLGCQISNYSLTLHIAITALQRLKLLLSSNARSGINLASRQDAVSTQSVTLSAKLQGTPIALQDIGKLAVGDILQFKHKLESPIRLEKDHQAIQTHAFLVKKAARKSLIFYK